MKRKANATTELMQLTMRDYFATAAMQCTFGGAGARQVADRDTRYDETNWAEVIADNAYRMADAMIRQRKITSEQLAASDAVGGEERPKQGGGR